ncbi:hypothetical protein ZWY2020_046386 [Hordeum vulgare]|nr:hypothetical protein ZWY2020_046386 [Hordeum vulgare]
MELEVCLAPHVLARLVGDQELMNPSRPTTVDMAATRPATLPTTPTAERAAPPLSASSQKPASSDGFLGCLTDNNVPVFTQSSHFFMPLLNASIRNPKFFVNTTVRPLYIVMPTTTPHVQEAAVRGRDNKMPIRVRSGGHDYEGLSYRSVDAGVLPCRHVRATHHRRGQPDINGVGGVWRHSESSTTRSGNDSNMLGFPAGGSLEKVDAAEQFSAIERTTVFTAPAKNGTQGMLHTHTTTPAINEPAAKEVMD